jgi:hypothetical protein
MIFQIDFALKESEKEKHHICVKRKLNRQFNNDEQQKTNYDIRCNQIFFFKKKSFHYF